VKVQEIRWENLGSVRTADYNIFYGKRNENYQLGRRYFVNHRILRAVKILELVSDMVYYVVLRGRWCNIFVMNVYAASEEKRDGSKDSFNKELEQVLNIFLRNLR
jgi:hypothetical protein